MDTIQIFDTQLFLLINHLPHTSRTDFAAQALSGFGYAWVIWFVIGIVLFLRKEKKDHWFWVPLAIAAGLCYFVSELLIKYMVARARPDMLSDAIIVGVHPLSFSFPSTHAAVAFAFAYLFSRKEAHWFWLYVLALLVCFSRIYLGHHFPSDVIAGMMLGTIIGIVSMKIDEILHMMKCSNKRNSSKKRSKRV